jgi:hypothetical protein
MSWNYTKQSSRPQRVAHAIYREARRGNPDLASGVVDLHAGQLSRAECLSVMRWLFVHIARTSKPDAEQ